MRSVPLRSALACAMSAIALVACGGGGSDTPAAATATNPFASMAGTWVSSCTDDSNSPTDQYSSAVTAVVSDISGTDSATLLVDAQVYKGSNNCAAATRIANKASISGLLTALAGKKIITGDTSHPKVGTAVKASFRLDSVTKNEYEFTVPPLLTTTTVGYLVEGNKLYGVGGSRESDGLGTSFVNVTLTKQ